MGREDETLYIFLVRGTRGYGGPRPGLAVGDYDDFCSYMGFWDPLMVASPRFLARFQHSLKLTAKPPSEVSL